MRRSFRHVALSNLRHIYIYLYIHSVSLSHSCVVFGERSQPSFSEIKEPGSNRTSAERTKDSFNAPRRGGEII